METNKPDDFDEFADDKMAEGADPVFRAIQELCAENETLREEIFNAVCTTEEIYSKAYGSGPRGLEIKSGIALSKLRRLRMPDDRIVMRLMLSTKYAPCHVTDFTDPTLDAHVWVLEVSSEGKITAFSELPFRQVRSGTSGLQ